MTEETDAIREKIIFTLINEGKPMRHNELARKSGLYPQLLKYHLPTLISLGLVLKLGMDGDTFYTPQMIFMNKEIDEKIQDKMGDAIKILANNLCFEQCENKERAIRACFIAWLDQKLRAL